MLAFALFLAGETAIYVSPAGNDRHDGLAAHPVATLARAVELSRSARIKRIVVGRGEYALEASLILDARDEGLLLEGAEGVRPLITGAVKVSASELRIESDSETARRALALDREAKVYAYDARRWSRDDLLAYAPYGFPRPIVPGPNEVFLDAEPLRIARWPNQGFAMAASIREPGNGESDRLEKPRKPVFTAAADRPKAWAGAENGWLYGYWKYDWADETIRIDSVNADTGEITLATPHNYGVALGARFFAENMSEELDAVGEYFVEERAKTIRFVSKDLGEKAVRISRLSEPLLTVKEGKRITVRGLDFGFSRGDGARLEKCEDTVLAGCRFFDLGERGVVVAGGKRSGLRGCDVWNTAQGGVSLDGGNRRELEPGENFVENCDIFRYQRKSATYRPAVLMAGVGNRVVHCRLRDAPHSAIIFSGNEHRIEQNEIDHVLALTGDGGAVYTGRDWTARGTRVNRNYFHDNVGISKWEPAIYFDDLASGLEASGNVIVRCHWGFLIGGGRDNLLADNLIVDCKLGFHLDARGLGWAARSRPTMEERLLAVPYKGAVWAGRYPKLVDIFERDPMAPMDNVLRRNTLVRSGKLKQDTAPEFERTAKFEGNVERESISADELARAIAGMGLIESGERASLRLPTLVKPHSRQFEGTFTSSPKASCK